MSSQSARVAAVRRIADEVAGPAAASVDAESRFPREAFDALKQARLLSTFVPADLGGDGASLLELGAMCELLGQRCASTAMVFAMHQIQVACLVRHGLRQPFFRSYLASVAREQRLIASVTSEAGVGGSVRTSISPIRREGGMCTLEKDGTVVSYGEAAQDWLVTVRRSPEAPQSDQAIVLLRKAECELTKTGTWDTFGMRGTCSPGYVVKARFPEEQIVPAPFGEMLGQTMAPFAHALWGCVWLGIATDAVARARAFVRSVAKQMPGATPPQAARLSEVAATLQLMRAQVHGFARRYAALIEAPDGGLSELGSIAFALELNNVKVNASRLCPEIVTAALRICGMAGYRNDGKYSVTRHLRDAHSAALMIGNERILASNATLHLALREEQSGLVPG
jgi:acyl-CoA dehydrogenase